MRNKRGRIRTSAKKCPFVQDLRSITANPGREPSRDTCMKRHVEISFRQEQCRQHSHREIDLII